MLGFLKAGRPESTVRNARKIAISSFSRIPADSETDEPQPAEVAIQLERILADPLFHTSQRLSDFLRFTVESILRNESGQLKEYVIGTEVFKLGAAYNPQENPVVRIMAGRLRGKLAEYYLSRGLADPVFIEMPKGGYAPRFIKRPASAFAKHAEPVQAPASRPVCVGREHELNRLWSAFSTMGAGGAMWDISGEAGIGKTTLGEEFLAVVESQAPGAWIARGSGSERLAETDAFAPILESLDALLLAATDAVVEAAMKANAPSWFRQLTPVIAEAGASFIAGGNASHERMRREMAAFFRELSRSKPIVLFLDDMHWADQSTCDLLAYLGSRLHGMRLFILMTHRPETASDRDNPFRRLKFDLDHRGVWKEIPLPFLGVNDIARYLAGRFPVNRFPEEFSGVLYERTEGNPMFLASLLRFLQDRGELAQDNGTWLLAHSLEQERQLVPGGISSLIRLKLDQLTDDELQLLACASVQGMQFDSAVVAQALSITPTAVEERLQNLETTHGFVRCLGEQKFPNHALSLRYRFVHVYYQNQLFASLTPSRRAERSREVAQALVSVIDGTSRPVAADAALLFEAGHDYASAAQYFLYAARNAARLFAYPEAIGLCERGLRVLSEVKHSRERDAHELALLQILSLALMANRGYAVAEVEKIHRRSLDLCLALNDTRRLMPVLWGLHTCEVNAGNLQHSLQLAKQMQELAKSSGEPPAPSLHALGTTLAFMGRLSEAREALEQIFRTQPTTEGMAFRSVYLLDPTVTSLSMLARLLTLMGHLDEAMEKATSSIEIANSLAHPQSIAYATFWLGWIHHARGEHEESHRQLEPAISLSREHGLALIQEWGRVVQGSALAHLGRLNEGIDEIRTSLANQKAMRSLLERAYCLTLLAEAFGRRGPSEEALGLCDEALEFGTRTEGRCYEPEAHRVRGELLLALGQAPFATVEGEFEQALALARESQCRLLELRAAVSYFRLQQGAGHPARGREALTGIANWFAEGASCPVLAEARKLLGDPG